MKIYTRPLLALIFYSTSALLVCGSAAAQTWVSTSTQAIGPNLLNATSEGNVADSTPVHVNVALQIQNKPALVEYLQQINTPGSPLYPGSGGSQLFAGRGFYQHRYGTKQFDDRRRRHRCGCPAGFQHPTRIVSGEWPFGVRQSDCGSSAGQPELDRWRGPRDQQCRGDDYSSGFDPCVSRFVPAANFADGL